MYILAIDPGPLESAYVLLDENLKPIDFQKIKNDLLYEKLKSKTFGTAAFDVSKTDLVFEKVESYGMAVGAEVFETVFWTGRFWEAGLPMSVMRIGRKEVKLNLCNDSRAKDSNIKQALIDRFAFGVPNGGKGTVKAPGWFYGFAADVWQAYALGVTYADKYKR